jgi:hypothetical protein
MPQQDFRARLTPKNLSNATDVLGERSPDNILNPLWATNGVLFPYTPLITSGSVAEYDQTPFTHTNYSYNAYVRSYPKPILITAEFTAQTNVEALYLLAVLHFFRSVTKTYFGTNPYNKAGTPPPVLHFSYLGDYQFNKVPVVVKSFDYTYDPALDYVPVSTTGASNSVTNKTVNLPKTSSEGVTYVPTFIRVNIELDTQYVPLKIRDEFNLDEFRSGKLFNKGFI